MNKFLLAVLCTAGLAGCAHYGTSRGIDPKFPQVSVVNNFIVVNQEPILTRRGDRITWQLPAHSKLLFTTDGVIVDTFVGPLPKPSPRPIPPKAVAESVRAKQAGGLFVCGPEKDLREFICTVPKDARPGQYSYVLRLKDGDQYLILDPTIFVEE